MKKISISGSSSQVIDCAPLIEAVDLGLSVKWANANLEADTPEQYGGYYAWGETEAKSYYSWSTYKWCKGTHKTLTKYCCDEKYGTFDRKTWWLDVDDDAAHIKLGGKWRIPNRENWSELRHDCIWTWTNLNGVDGYLVTSKIPGFTDKSIFLPAAGYREDERREAVGRLGCYWSSSLYLYRLPNHLPYTALCAYFDFTGLRMITDDRMFGHSVRPICEY